MEKPAVVVDNVSMKFNLSKEKVDSLKDYVIKFLKKEIKYNEFWAHQISIPETSWNIRASHHTEKYSHVLYTANQNRLPVPEEEPDVRFGPPCLR